MFSVTISEKGGQQSKLDFSKPDITIGRMKGNDIVLPKSNVSKQHTRISIRDNGFFIADLKSTNGTYVNGRKVAAEQPITEQDKIYIGDFILQVERSSAAAHQAGPPQPPQPPQPPPATPGPRQTGGRHFPTVMDGPNLGASMGGLQPGQPNTPPPVSAPDRRSSGAGIPMNPPAAPPTPQAPPAAPDELRQTMGDAGPFDFQMGEAAQEQQPPTSLAEPTPTPIPVSAPIEPLPPQQPPAPVHTPPPAAAPQSAPLTPPTQAVAPIAPVEEFLPAAPVSPMAAPRQMENEFDEDFHRAQQDVARVFFDTVGLHEIPLDYPLPEGPERSRIEQAVSDAVSAVNPSQDHQALTDALIKEATGLGALEDYLDDSTVQEIYINAYDRVILRSEGALVLAPRAYGHPDFLDLAARRLLGPQDVPPVSDEVRFSDGTRVHILMPPLAVDGPALTIRKPNTYFPDLPELVENGALSAGMAEFLERAVEAGRSIVIAGPSNSGKSTLLASLAAVIPPSSRVIAVEEHSNIPSASPSFIRLEASPSSGFDMRFLLRNAVAMHPERILVDECRGAEAYDWVTAAASGTEGSMLTLHGATAVDALGRLESMCLLGASDVSPRGLREQIARSVDLVVVLHATSSGGVRVHQIAEVQGVDLDAFRLNDIFYYRVEGAAGVFHPTGYIPLFYEDLRHAGFDVDLDIFRE